MQGEDACNQFIERCFYSNWMTRIFSNYFKKIQLSIILYILYFTVLFEKVSEKEVAMDTFTKNRKRNLT